MATSDPVMARVAALEKVLDDPESKASRRRLKDALTKKTALVVARAAELALELERTELVPDLSTAFFRLLEAGWEADRGCRAKEAIAKAMEGLGTRDFDVFLAGVRYVQEEPAFGPPVDTAVGLRSACAIALVNGNYYDAANVLAVLLADKERGARLNAAAALGSCSEASAVPLLRYKAVIGDEEPEVSSEVFAALLHLDGDTHVEFVSAYLESGSELVREAAALALGRSRLEAAFEALKAWVERPIIGLNSRKVAYLAMATSRTPKSRDYLCTLIADADLEDAALAAEALAIYRHDRALMERVESVVRRRNDPWLTDKVASLKLTPSRE